MELLIYFTILISFLVLTMAVGSAWNAWREKKEWRKKYEEFNFDEFNKKNFDGLI